MFPSQQSSPISSGFQVDAGASSRADRRPASAGGRQAALLSAGRGAGGGGPGSMSAHAARGAAAGRPAGSVRRRRCWRSVPGAEERCVGSVRGAQVGAGGTDCAAATMDVLAMDEDFLELSSGDMRDMWDTSTLLETVSAGASRSAAHRPAIWRRCRWQSWEMWTVPVWVRCSRRQWLVGGALSRISTGGGGRGMVSIADMLSS